MSLEGPSESERASFRGNVIFINPYSGRVVYNEIKGCEANVALDEMQSKSRSIASVMALETLIQGGWYKME
jgi:hypothetical protein